MRQVFVPLIIATFTLSGVIWIVRALRLLDRVILSGQGIVVWLELLIYTIPTVFATVLPSAFFIATLYAFYRLFMDREIIIMFSAGIGRTRLMRPVLMLAFLVAGLTLALTFYAGPWGQKMLKERALEINADITSTLLQPGVFTSPGKGITAFIRSRDDKGFLYGIFFQDKRNKDKPISYTAESGTLIYSAGKINLLMFNGHVQHYDKTAPQAGITLVKFQRYSYDISQLTHIKSSALSRSRELYPQELYRVWFDDKTSLKRKKNIFLFFSNAMLKALYIIAYAFIVLAIFLPAQVNRHGYTKRIALAIVAALALSFSHFPILTYAWSDIYFLILLYLNPIIASALAAFICLRGVGFIARYKHGSASKKIEKQPLTTAPKSALALDR